MAEDRKGNMDMRDPDFKPTDTEKTGTDQLPEEEQRTVREGGNR